MRYQSQESNTLCWKCRNAVPTLTFGCSWSLEGIPVEGWDADVRRAQESGHHIRDSFEVHSCPQFLPNCSVLLTREKRNHLDGTLNAFRGFAMSIVTQCIVDYRENYWTYIANKEFLELCVEKRRRFEDIRYWIFSKKQRARWFDNDEMRAFLDEKYTKIKKRYAVFNKWAAKATECETEIRRCEKFFASEEFLFYSDMDGIRIMHMIQDELHRRYDDEIGGRREGKKG